MANEIPPYRFEGVSSLWREIFHLAPQNPPPEATSIVCEHWTAGGSRTCRNDNPQTQSLTKCNVRVFRSSKWSTDLNHGFGEEFGSEQLQHRVHYILPALPEDVAMPMGKVKHCLGGCLCLTIAAKHCRKVFHRLQGENTPTFSQNFETIVL